MTACGCLVLFHFFTLLLFLAGVRVAEPGLQQQHSVLPGCHQDDRSALLEFKQDLYSCYFDDHDNRNVEEWGKESAAAENCCMWQGITCDKINGRVIGLDLSTTAFCGSINSRSSLFRLINLRYLNLASIDFNYSAIPTAIGNLSKLQSLNLSYCNFAGSLPSEILSLTNMSSLDLSGNYIQSLNGASIFELPNLRILDLSWSQRFSGHFPEFKQSYPLTLLNLKFTNFSGELPVSLANLGSLNVLDIERCNFRGPIPSSIGNLTNLSVLILSLNKFHGQIPSLANLSGLTMLDLHDNLLVDKVPSAVGNLTQLSVLDISFNGFHGPIPSAVFQLSKLQVLNLQGNSLTGTVRLDMFLQLQHLNYLVLSYNELSLLNEPNMNASRSQFAYLGLASCNLSEFPRLLQGQGELWWLDLSSNGIYGRIPAWFLNVSLNSLEYLNLSGNSLTGFSQYPNVFNWTSLVTLDVSSNKLNGSLPVPPESVDRYLVSNNRFSGVIPPAACNLSNLRVLGLAENNFTGTIPECLGNLSNLEGLVLRDNKFSGSIPKFNESMHGLVMLDIGKNQFGGPLPRSLSNCVRLKFLNVENNRINGTFPAWLGSLAYLRVLVLRSNRFHGVIREHKSDDEFPMLQIIDISQNNFDGFLPFNYLGRWGAMRISEKDQPNYIRESFHYFGVSFSLIGKYYMIESPHASATRYYSTMITSKGTQRLYSEILENLIVIDFSSNNFSGEIPNAIGSLVGLRLLNLSNNFLSGPIPPSLKDLMKLESLDLSRNNLTGEIPQQLTQLTFLGLFNVSYNQLTGLIPQAKQFGTFGNDSYRGNPGLCGAPLSKQCKGPEISPPPPSEDDDNQAGTIFEFDWKIICMGFACGLVIGLVLGQNFITIGRNNWFVRKYGHRY